MEHTNLPAVRPANRAWNRDRVIGQKRPLLPRHVLAIRVRLKISGSIRDLALFNLAIDSKLRGCDLARPQARDVFSSDTVKERASVIQQKANQPVRFEITESTRRSLLAWLASPAMAASDYLWPGRLHNRAHISTRQYEGAVFHVA
ncbi:hypothetical protein [Frigidibacter sp. MR17.24]|uniref:hypothetical protein n=1 Tax=Frigidibacter sp. MR17.24 TaxID=3127345 RepID=UPI003012FF55